MAESKTVSKEELLHIANLAMLELKEDEIENYLLNLQDILNFTNTISNAPVKDLDITIGTGNSQNKFRKDEVNVFEDTKALLANGKEVEQNMFKLPKVIN